VFTLPGKGISEMTYTVSGRILNPTHSLTLMHFCSDGESVNLLLAI